MYKKNDKKNNQIMKIGILTFHRAENFGAVLQCLALSHYLEEIGHQVMILDYRCQAIEKQYKIVNWNLLKPRRIIWKRFFPFFRDLLHYQYKKNRKKAYSSFRQKYLTITNPIYCIEQVPKDLDIYITGSDQVWNGALTNGLDDFFWLNFPVNKNAKKFSFAASCETTGYRYLEGNAKKIKEILTQYSKITVREEVLKKQLQSYCNINNIDVVIDPTLLLPKEFYTHLVKKPLEENYLLVYHLRDIKNDGIRKYWECIAKEKNLQIIEIHTNFNSQQTSNNKIGVGPEELLSYLYYADYVFTNSFHATILSILFHNEFYSVDDGQIARIKNILKKLELTDRILTPDNIVQESDKIDFKQTDNLLLNLTQSTKNLINSFL